LNIFKWFKTIVLCHRPFSIWNSIWTWSNIVNLAWIILTFFIYVTLLFVFHSSRISSCSFGIFASRFIRKAFFDNRLQIDTQIDPLITFDISIRNSNMHLICNNVFGSLWKHNSSTSLSNVKRSKIKTKGLLTFCLSRT
jgi:hypothetical protein